LKWNKEKFLEELTSNTSREVAKVGIKLYQFIEKNADEISWGKGSEYGTVTYKTKSDLGLLSLFQLTTRGEVKFYVNYLRQKVIHKSVVKDYVIKLESNFLRDFDKRNYPTDSFCDINELFHTSTQVNKLIQTIEGIAYRLRL